MLDSIARFGLDQLNKKSNAIQKEIGMKMKVLPTTGTRGEAKLTRGPIRSGTVAEY